MTDFVKLKNIMTGALRDDKTAHDDLHVLRVLEYAMEIAKNEKEVDLEVLEAAVLLHDIAFMEGFHKGEHEDTSARIAEPILRGTGTDSKKIPLILRAIELHNWFLHFEVDVPIEIKILRDADRLDALGENAIERALLFHGKEKLIEGLKHIISVTEQQFETKTGKELGLPMIEKLKIYIKEHSKS